MVLKCFHLNPGTGGLGAHNGGDGVVREFLFRKPLTLSILTERRVFAPYGLRGNSSTQRPLPVLVALGLVSRLPVHGYPYLILMCSSAGFF